MCLYPILIENKKFKNSKKNQKKGYIPKCEDFRTKYVPVPCGKCYECLKKKGREWSIRLQEEIKSNPNGIFVTLTFNNDSINELSVLSKEPNQIATIAVRRFLERYRQKNKHSIKHWLITELGHTGTERIHLHGIIWGMSKEEINKFWNYGYTYIGNYLAGKTATYVTKYITKIDLDHKEFNGKILCSKGIGSQYKGYINQYNNEDTNQLYTFKNGTKCQLPTYYRKKFYSEDEREKLWIYKLNEQIRWIDGVKCDANDTERIEKILQTAQNKNKRLGFLNRTYTERERDNYSKIIEKINLQTKKLDIIRKAKGDEKEYRKLLKKELNFEKQIECKNKNNTFATNENNN